MKRKGAVAAGHPETARAATIILEAGGNAFDAALAAFCASCVVEPVLSSLGGGGFLMAQKGGASPLLYDFFSHTPKVKRPIEEVDFYPILADFGTATQEFHIGFGSMAAPGCVHGLFAVHNDLGRMPLSDIVEPARKLAFEGFPLNKFQAYIFDIVQAIYTCNSEVRGVFGSADDSTKPKREGDILALPEFADTLDALAREGEALFSKGEIGQRLIKDSRERGGYLSESDLVEFEVIKRDPLRFDYHDAAIFTNPPPSAGGMLIAFAVELLKASAQRDWRFGSLAHLELLANVMGLTNEYRLQSGLDKAEGEAEMHALFTPELVAQYRAKVHGRPYSHRGTTQISVMDADGNAASMTVSNGEGSGYMIPGTGIMMNNMLGEEDINPRGFHNWREDMRMSSMMAPSIALLKDSKRLALGSGGSNRIRTAILQVLINFVDFGMGLKDAIDAPRIHFEHGHLGVEPGLGDAEVKALCDAFDEHLLWDDRNLFFGGVHGVSFDPRTDAFEAEGDPRRGGAAILI